MATSHLPLPVPPFPLFSLSQAALTKYGQSEEVYEENVKALTVTCANMAATTKVGIFIEVSTAQVYSGGKKASNEESTLRPTPCTARGCCYCLSKV